MHATVRGIPAGRTVAPETLEATRAVLAEASVANESVAFVGGATELEFGYAPRAVDVLVETTRLDRIVEYQPADMVVEVECGMTLAALQAALLPQGQRLALDPPLPERATIGGLVATNAFGPRRARYGTLRDLIVGVSLIRADGTRVRGGGKVVKNVAGFDLPKLAVGSLGTLGMIATATFRLHPVAETTTALRVGELDAEGVAAIVRDLIARQLEPVALLATRTVVGSYELDVIFEGFAAGVAEQCERFVELTRARGARAATLEDFEAPFARATSLREGGDVRVRFAVPPADFARFERDALAPLGRTLAGFEASAYPSLGIVFSRMATVGNAAASAALAAARRYAEGLGGHAVLLETSDDVVAAGFDVYGTLPPSFALMRGLKDRFDPAHRLNPGRFLGKL